MAEKACEEICEQVIEAAGDIIEEVLPKPMLRRIKKIVMKCTCVTTAGTVGICKLCGIRKSYCTCCTLTDAICELCRLIKY